MNAMLNISINVLSRQAIGELRRMRAEMNAMQTAQVKGASAARGFTGALGAGAASMEKFGKNVQWSGRQLEYNFTLPLIIAGGVATKWALDNERAMVRVRKVYGGLGEDVSAELDAIEESFKLLSNRFGVALAEVTEIGAAWAQAGAAGVAVPKAVRASLEAMILGELEAVDATEKMIAVQSAYRLNTEGLSQAIADLNAIENQTSINFGGLIEVITRAGGASRAAGISMNELAGMAAILVPAAGSSAQAGNSLRTMMSRLLAPTKQASELLNEMGLEIDGVSWQSKTGTERLKTLANSFDALTQNQKASVSTYVASRWQINRFNLLMEDLKLSLDPATAAMSTFATAQDAVADSSHSAALKARELSAVLASSPRAFEILTTNIKNAMAEAIVPLLPTIIALMAEVAKLIKRFNELSPATQSMILSLALLLAVIGPVARYIGTFGILLGTLGHALHFVLVKGMALVGFFIGWPAVIIAAVAAIIYFRKEIYEGLVGAFNALPAGIQGALLTVLRMVKSFALAVYGWLQYLNPFARHSPSLVDNVTRGIDTILDQYKRLNGVKAVIGEAISAHRAFLSATGAASRSMRMEEFQMQKADIVAVAPGAGPAVDSMVSSIFRMEGALEAVNQEMRQQQQLVYDMERQIDTAMKPMNDAIFENEMAQKKLRLEILKMEQEGGGSIDDIRNKYALLSGDIEKMSSKREDLRLAGAGSEITGTFDREIDALMEQRKALEGQSAPIDEARKKLEDLQRTGEIAQLERDIQFDPQLRELDAQRDKLHEIEGGYDDIASAIRDMEGALTSFAGKASAKLARDESARKAAEAAAKTAAGAGSVSDAVEKFRAGAHADFEVPGGEAPPGLGREGGLAEIEEFNKALEAELATALDEMGGIDLIAPFRDAFNKAKEWVITQVDTYLAPIWESITGWFDGRTLDLDTPSWFEGMSESIGSVLEDTGDIIGKFVDVVQEKWNLLWEIFGPIMELIVENVAQAGRSIGDELKNWGPTFGYLAETVSNVFSDIVGVIQGVFAILTPIITAWLSWVMIKWNLFWPTIRNVVEAVWDALIGVIRAALQIVRGIITLGLALINGDWGKMWEGFVTIIDGVWDAIYAVFRGAWDILFGIVSGLVEGIVGFFKWLYDTLVGHSIIPDLVDEIIRIFTFLKDAVVKIWDTLWKGVKWVWDNVVSPIWDAIVLVVKSVLVPLFEGFRDTVKAVWDAIGGAIQWTWTNVLKPVWDAIGRFVSGPLTTWFENFKNNFKRIWEAVGNGARWVWDNMLKPTWDTIIGFITNTLAPKFHWLASKIGDAWTSVRQTAAGAWNGILSVIGGAVNKVIDIINTLIRGINKLSNLPGININISEVGRVSWGNVSAGTNWSGLEESGLATGGRIPENPHESRVGAGFRTNRVRAIVGEGNPLYPEYVIPTDPNFRGRAVALAQALSKDIGIPFMHPQYAAGGILDTVGDAWDATGGKVVSGIKKGAAMAMFAPFNKLAEAAINMVPVPFMREAAQAAREIVYNWVKGTDEKVPEAPSIMGGPGAWMSMWGALKDQFPNARLHSGYRPGSITATGNLSYHARGRAIDVSPRSDIFEWIHANYPNSRELIFSPKNNRQIRNGRPHYYSGVTRSMHWDHVHWAMANGGIIPNLANGGIVPPSPGGTLVRVGERGQSEAIQPLPRDFQGGNTYIFNGDLEFPNITDAGDAETFIANLESLV